MEVRSGPWVMNSGKRNGQVKKLKLLKWSPAMECGWKSRYPMWLCFEKT